MSQTALPSNWWCIWLNTLFPLWKSSWTPSLAVASLRSSLSFSPWMLQKPLNLDGDGLRATACRHGSLRSGGWYLKSYKRRVTEEKDGKEEKGWRSVITASVVRSLKLQHKAPELTESWAARIPSHAPQGAFYSCCCGDSQRRFRGAQIITADRKPSWMLHCNDHIYSGLRKIPKVKFLQLDYILKHSD